MADGRTKTTSETKGSALKGAKGKGAYHHGNLREALIDAALRLIETEGSRALTLRATARLAGVSEAAPYRHFNDKADLLAAVAAGGFGALTGYMEKVGAEFSSDPLARFERLGQAYIEFASDNPARFRVMTGPELQDVTEHEDLSQASQEAFGLLTDALSDCQRSGVVGDGDVRVMAMAAWGMVHGLASLLIDGRISGVEPGLTDPVALMRQVGTQIFRGLAPRPSKNPAGTKRLV